uniref:Uncharacterized protein LOC104232750 n=1 Tax=Nicotiana sylvestris TaxID=4096 RepID=A0A1U7WWM5_NICSY|nr:PREDICTED: uncharacterized protein LOC104232750 [Nicotiana sylvestris]XP_009784326.1 PREDICTED: uncharacterized protein LOC104232750 [Nicotiana sylvestris]
MVVCNELYNILDCGKPSVTPNKWKPVMQHSVDLKRLQKWGRNVNSTCVLCQAATESIDNLFGERAFAKDSWVKLPNWMQIQPAVTTTWNQYFYYVIQHVKGEDIYRKPIQIDLCRIHS